MKMPLHFHPSTWTAGEIERAQDALRADVDPAGDGRGRWSTFMRFAIDVELRRLLERQGGLNVMTEEGRKAYCEMAGERRALERFLKPDFGLTAAFEKELE